MPTKQILFNEESRKAILKGMDIVADAVGSTMGARGKMVLVGRKNGTAISKDGWTVAKSINLEDPIECIGANCLKEVALKTVNEAGDSTTGATILTRAILKEGFKLISSGYNSFGLKKGIEKAVINVLEQIKSMALSITIDSEKLKQIAIIAANNDEVIGSIVAEAIQKTGKDGVLRLSNSNTGETHIEKVDGLQFDRSYIDPAFINNPSKLTCELINPYILVAEGKIEGEKDILPIFKLVADQERPLLIIAEFIEGNAKSVLVYNKLKGYPVCAVKAPSFGENQKKMLQDIAVVVGADVAAEQTGFRLDTLKLSNLGTSESVVITKDNTTIVGGKGKKHDIESHIAQVRISLSLSSNELERVQNEERLAKLLGGVGVIYVGGESELEITEKKDRYDDSVRASRCALEKGIVCGGGVTYLKCIKALDNIETSDEDEKAGIRVIKKILEVPFIQMIKNAELDYKISISDILKGEENYGYNFKLDKFENLLDSGVIDAAMVLMVALKNATSVASALLTSNTFIVNWEDNKPQIQP